MPKNHETSIQIIQSMLITPSEYILNDYMYVIWNTMLHLKSKDYWSPEPIQMSWNHTEILERCKNWSLMVEGTEKTKEM